MTLSRALLHPTRLALAGALSLALVGACTDGPGPARDVVQDTAATTRPTAPTAPTARAAAATSADDPVDYVVAISVDGLNPHAIRQLGRSGAPNFYRMIDNGATTQNARTAYEQTITIPNHTGMLTGRRITGTGGHHVTFDEDNGTTVARQRRRLREEHLRRGAQPRGQHRRSTPPSPSSTSCTGRGTPRTAAPTRSALTTVATRSTATSSTTSGTTSRRMVARLHANPDELSFLHLAEPDRAGHADGFMSASYVRAVADADRQLGRVLAAVRNDTRLLRHANVVLTADHGGKGASHTDATRPYDYIIPFMVWGRGVARGADLYDLNTSDRRRPATRRPTYAGRQPIRNLEVANVVADLLDLPTVPGSIANTAQDLTVR